MRGGQLVSERRSDDMSAGMTKLWRQSCFKAIGGVVREVMWDAIDCHKARQLGWKAISWDEPELRFEHLRPMGSSQNSIYTGRRRHGFGQHFMGADPLVFHRDSRSFVRWNPLMFWVGSLCCRDTSAPC